MASADRPGARRVTIADVAREAQVSKATVSRALNAPEVLRPDTLEHVLGVVARLGFAPNLNARSLTTGRTLVIGVVLSDIQVPFFTSVARAVQDAARARGYLTLVGNSDERAEAEDDLIRAFASRMVDGLIVTPAAGDNRALREVAERIPVVTVDRIVEGVSAARVVSDNFAGALNATRHLLGLGHRRIAYLSSPLDKSSAVERYRGFRAGLDEAGIAFDPRLLRAGDYHVGAVVTGATELLEDMEPTAALTSEASVSVGVLRAAEALGLAVPDDLSVLGFDPLDWGSPELSAVVQDTERLGAEAMGRLLRRLEGRGEAGPDVVRVPTRLMVRESCAPPRVRQRG
ncbi:MAG TPA: LacI family DNA-binding transcriptional regulator [Baekduia sp.]|uniref:LacI family DNA-binding transcriptional regulator n=1 Tax=Baekduia sp. TaxID=2600305 RepID=UPI002D7720BE|nr:LacI family DNA-binding transcriptional regulator [Baekduia sp.]HET6508160.1 LacI family DNA-binding transcriptional regulator [Baekduia sp.]